MITVSNRAVAKNKKKEVKKEALTNGNLRSFGLVVRPKKRTGK